MESVPAVSNSGPRFQFGQGFLGLIPDEIRRLFVCDHIVRTKSVLTAKGLFMPDKERLTLIVEAALEVRALYFTAALFDPTAEDVDFYFDDFIVRAVRHVSHDDPDGAL